METSTPLAGLAALVTGADRGIGRGIALELGRAGCRVAVNYFAVADAAAANAVVAELAALGVDGCAVQADVRVAADVSRMTRAAVDRFGRLDVLVNNAGVQTSKP